MTVSSIGATARDYATIALWEAACPANITAGGTNENWEGEMYNDSEFVVTTNTVFSGVTTDSTHTIQLRCATGQSFKSSGAVALNYNVTNGVGVRCATTDRIILHIQNPYVVVTGLQLYNNGGTSYQRVCAHVQGGHAGVEFHQNIMKGGNAAAGTFGYALVLSGAAAGQKAVNNLIIGDITEAGGAMLNRENSSLIAFTNNTIVKGSDLSTGGSAVTGNYSSLSLVKNNACFGPWTNFFSGTFAAGSGYNGTSHTAAPGSNNQTSLTYANQFENTTNASGDFRLKTGNNLEANGTRVQADTNDVDIKGTTRSTTTPDIGAFEVGSSSSDTPITVTSADATWEGAGVNLLFDEAYVITVTNASQVAEPQDIFFQLSQPYTSADAVGEGSSVNLSTLQIISVDSADVCGEGQSITMPVAAPLTSADGTFQQSNVSLIWSEAVVTGASGAGMGGYIALMLRRKKKDRR